MPPEPAPLTPPSEDAGLLRRYAGQGDEGAFAELVQRRIGLVYAVALRQTRGNRAQAEDATQAVFTDLARKAATLAARPVLVGWLHRSAQFAATSLIRAEHRRLAREQEAHLMENTLATPEPVPDWDKLRPVLDEVLNEIEERDRDSILLRYFDNRSFTEIGTHLRLTENAARMRTERALDKLHAALVRRGVRSTTAALGLALGAQAGAALPAGLVSAVTGTALAASAATAGGALISFMALTKLQVGIISAVAAALATGYVMQGKTNARLRSEIAKLHEPQQAVAALRAENRQLATTSAEIETLRHDDTELKQLAQNVADLQRTNQEKIRIAQTPATADARQAEIDRMNREGNALVEQYKALNDRLQVLEPARDPIEKSARDYLNVQAQRMLAAIEAKQREVQAAMAAAGVSPPAPTPDPEMARLNREGQALTAQARLFAESAREPSLSPTERAAREAKAQQIWADVQAKVLEVKAYVSARNAFPPPRGSMDGSIGTVPAPPGNPAQATFTPTPPPSVSGGLNYRLNETPAETKPVEPPK